ncbi:hypothetical protein COLO4_05447 [Corchorus olitorius]|uniref:Uncharacterized protein n=1 Tax=Corchorus olitorius TaxID=93759 RepID=A0A1R3KQX7_9ROSI|nr:hypothetical protein COLO4_05447 [Corchorus olitorius]
MSPPLSTCSAAATPHPHCSDKAKPPKRPKKLISSFPCPNLD